MIGMMAGLMAANAAGGGGDPSYASVASLLHFDGANGATSITDQKGKVWTANGNAQLSTTTPKFGTACGLFDGNGDYWQTPADASFNATGDFTIEFWVNFATVAGRQIFLANSGTALWYFDFRRSGSANMSFALGGVLTGSTLFSAGTWYHVAACRSGTTLRLFVNGALDASATETTSGVGTGPIQIGCAPSIGGATLGLNGRLDDFRFTAGVARYTAAFTPPASAFPDS